LYPLKFDNRKAARVRVALRRVGDNLLNDEELGRAERLPVVAAAFLASGAAMSERFRAAALNAARNDVYADLKLTLIGVLPEFLHGSGRKLRAQTMHELIIAIERHRPGRRMKIAHRGVCETLAAMHRAGMTVFMASQQSAPD
jgi:hypothetical protein